MFEYRLFPGDPVVNLSPHRDSNGFLIHLNELGVVDEVNEEAKSVIVLWSHGVSTTVNMATVTQPSITLNSSR